uniref:Queuosine biosynthesis protein n=1 Tax=uncultured bacterium 293 TaxID=698389 RepID=E3T628_9BACT|nr:queuosine biosynthesis protein [uncultured bacterium 293]
MLDLPALLQPGDLLVLNRSRVIPARLHGRRASGQPAEVLLLQPADGEKARGGPRESWHALLRPGKRLRAGDSISIGDDLTLHVEDAPAQADGRRRVTLVAARGTVEQAIERDGHVPLPPYIRRGDTPADRLRYQTIYARERGSVAAPTAGLHLSERVFTALRARGVEWTEVLLHVGPGTFQPVRAEQVEDHRLPPEPAVIPEEAAAAVAAARARGGRVVAVGTTAVRALESAAGDDGRLRPGARETDLVIVPGYRFRVVDALLTNFHLPRSSLLLLVAAFTSRERVLDAYAHAVRAGYRFYSYGDAMLLR